MAAHGGPDLIQDGLVLSLDAGNIKSYPSSGTTWRDLTANRNNGTLTNGPTFNNANGGSIVFDGSNDYTELGNILNVGTSDFTIEAWFYKETKLNSFPKLVSKGAYQAGGWRLLEDNGLDLTFQYGNPQSEVISPTTLVNDRWNHALVTRLSGNITVYANGQGGTSTAVGDDLTTNSYTYQLATSPNGGENWKGRIAMYRHYNIGFTQAMVLQNFNANRKRFGL